MSDLTVTESPMTEPSATSPHPASIVLTTRAAKIASDVADVLDQHCSTDSGATETARFLRDWSKSTDAHFDTLPIPLDRVARRYALTEHECDLLLLAGLADEHEGLAATFRSIHPQGEPFPTVGLAALLIGGGPTARARLRALLSAGAAVRHGLLLVGSGTFFERSLTLPESTWNALHGCDAWPSDMERIDLEPPPPGLDVWLACEPASIAVEILRHDRTALLLVLSDDEAVGRARCAALLAAAHRDVVVARVEAHDGERTGLLLTHAAVRGAVPMLVVSPAANGAAVPLSLGDVPGAIIVCAAPGTVRPSPDRAVVAVPADPVGMRDLHAAWAAAIPNLAPDAAALAARHPLDPAITAQIAVDVRAHRRNVDRADIAHLINVRAGASLPIGVQLTIPKVPWNAVVLPPESGMQLRDAVARLDHQGVVLDDWELRERAHASRGGRLLFTGPPGTGKSLAAAAVATAANTGLLIVDVSRVVSKWLGETEKNLAAAFDAAERTQAVLLLDEADALFATRTEISDAHDRYANLETAYLLQRLDRFDGLAILTTNLRANIDVAFIRRMDFVVDFLLPDEAGRLELWAQHLPKVALDDDIDLESVARLYAVPGGWIRNSAVAAAFSAAATHDHITQRHLVAAMRREYAKASLPFPGEPPRRRHDPT